MADREIRVVGVFQDGITPTLNKLNRQLLGTLKQFEKLQSKIAPVAAEMEKFNSAAASTAGNLKSQRSAIEENIRMLRQYRTELSKTATAQQRMGGMPRGARPTAPRGGAGGGAVPPVIRPPRGRDGGGVEGLGAGVFGVTLGNQLAGVITGAVIAGFQTGAQIMMAPFKFGAQALGERIRDEMSDVRTAGGLFSISKRMQKPIFGSFAEAENYTKEQNRYLAKLAGALPGDTQEYIQVSKQIADGIFTIVSQDSSNAQKLAKQLAQERGATAQELAKLSQAGPSAMQQTGKELVGEMTKLTVLAGLGGRQGAYGLPQLTERMLGEDQISMGMFQRYAAIFRDPMIKGALERNVAEINKAGKNTTARLEAIRNTFREIVTPELVRRYQRTTAGVLESLRTTFLNPEVGILGLGRPLATTTKKFDEFGQQLFTLSRDIEINGKTVKKGSEITAAALAGTGYALKDVAKAATDNLSIFDYLRDIFANLMIVLQPVIDNIVNIFDPLSKLGDVLAGMRERTMKFQNAFEQYRVYLEKTAKKMSGDAKAAFEGTIPFRAALAAINDAMRAYGGYGTDSLKEFQDVAAMLEDPKTTPKQMGEIIKGMLDKFLSSDFAKKIGEALGTVVGTVLSQVGEMMKVAAGLATASKLAEGFASGFQAAGGPQGFRDIIRSVFTLFGKLLIEVIKAAPLESAIAAALFFLPGAIAGLISQALSGGFATALGGGGGGGRGGKGGGRTTFFGGRAPKAVLRAQRGAQKALAPVGPVASTMMGMQPGRALIRQRGAIGGIARGAAKVGKAIPGGAIVMGVIDAVARTASGESAGKAIGGAAATTIGSVLGGSIGTIFGPAGTVLGSVAGGFIGDKLFSLLTPESVKQADAANKQLEAAQLQMNAVRDKGLGATGVDLGATSGLVADPMKLQQVINSLGLAADQNAKTLIDSTQQVRHLQDSYNSLNNQLAEEKSRLKNQLGFNELQVANHKTVVEMQGRLSGIRTKLSAAQKGLVDGFSKLPTKVQEEMANRIRNWTPTQLESAIAAMMANAIKTAPPVTTNVWNPAMPGTSTGIPPEAAAILNMKPTGFAKGNFNTSLGKAISYEMRHKPPGSDLVIANSSETIIPAADGMIGPSWLPWNWGKLIDQERKTSPLNRTNRMLEEMRQEGGYPGGLYQEKTSNYMRTTPMPTMVASGGGGGGGSFDVGKVEVTINDNSGDIAKVSDQAAEMILKSMYRQAAAEVITS